MELKGEAKTSWIKDTQGIYILQDKVVNGKRYWSKMPEGEKHWG